MFMPHSHTQHPSKPTPNTSPTQPANKQKKSNQDYITFIRNNHNMIEKHFMNDFQHPYKQSLMKSHETGNGDRKMSKDERNPQQYSSLFTLQQAPDLGKQAVSMKLHHSTNIEKVSRKHQIINSLNFSKPSLNIPITSHPFPTYRYATSTTGPVSKQQILTLIEQKNKQISDQLQRQRNNFSQIVYKNKHHSQSNVVRANNQSSGKNRQSVERDSNVGSREIRSLQKLRNEQNFICEEREDCEESRGNAGNRHEEEKAFRNAEKFERYNHKSIKVKDGAQYHSEPQTPQKSTTFILPTIKNRSQSYTNQQPTPQAKLSENPSYILSEYEIMSNIYSKNPKHPIVLVQASNQANNLSSSINQLRKQFQQNSDAIKMYKKVEKNNIELKVRQINQKNLKSYYQYETAIIKNAHYSMVEDQQRKNGMTMKDIKSKGNKNKAKIFSAQTGHFAPFFQEDHVAQGNYHESHEHKDTKTPQMTEGELFIKDIIDDRTKDIVKVFVGKNFSSLKKAPRHLPSPAQLEEQLTGRRESNQIEDTNDDEQPQPMSQRTPSNLSPAKLRKTQPKNPCMSIVPAVSKAQNTIYDLKMKAYREFAFKIYFSHKKFYPLVIRQLPSTLMRPEDKFKFYVGKGNNSLLIKSLMKRRFWWTLEEDPKKANFVWTQLKITSLYDYQRKSEVKHLYYKNEDTLADNSPDFAKRTKKRNLIKEDPLKQKKTFIFRAPLPEEDDMKVFTDFDKKIYNKFSFAQNESTNPQKLDTFQKRLAYFPQNYLDPVIPEQQKGENPTTNSYDESNPYSKNPETIFLKTVRMHNHFQFNHFIGNKKALFYNLRYYYQLIDKDVYDIIPLTFHIRNGVKDPEYAKFLKYYKAIEKKGKSHSKVQKEKQQQHENKKKKEKNIWIIKPGQNSNRGNGIQVFDQLYELNNILKKKDTNKDKNSQPHTYIVQKYIQKPLLYKNRKFDIRHYFVLTRMWGKMRAYFFGEGYIRTASYDFDLSNVGDTQIHLTNDAIQKHCDSYGKYEEGNKLSYVDFQRYMDSVAKEEQSKAYNSGKKVQNEKKAISFANDIYPQMRGIAIQAIKGCYLQMDPKKTQHNFEVFGMDFMIDKDYKVWLIEINTNPCLQLSSKLLQRVIPTMVEQSLRLTIDIIFPPPYHYPNTMKHMMPDYSLQKLKCELIFDEDRDGKQLEEMFNKHLELDKKEGRKSIREMLLGEIDEEDETYENDGKEINLGEKGVEVE